MNNLEVRLNKGEHVISAGLVASVRRLDLEASKKDWLFSDKETRLIECLFRGYEALGFDTDGDTSGRQMLARTGIGGNNLDEFIRVMDKAFTESREEMDEA